jgi:hypothetical protein
MKVREKGKVICNFDVYNVPAAKNEVAKSVRRMITELQRDVVGASSVRVINMDLPKGGQIRITVERV